jgi:hypothetical protein
VNDLASSVQSIHLGHLQINDNQIRLGFLKMFDGFFAVACLVTHPPVDLMLE